MATTVEKIQDKIATALDAGKVESVKKFRRDLGEHLADGANACPNCGYPPVGMIKTASYTNREGLEVPAVIEIGCVFCSPFYVVRSDGEEKTLDGKKQKVKRRSYSARAYSQADAVKKWNDQNFVEDFRFGVNITPEEEKRLG